MKNSREENGCYTIEREFLAKITVTELVNRIIHHYIMKEKAEEEMDFP